jgi:hypothetical protein
MLARFILTYSIRTEQRTYLPNTLRSTRNGLRYMTALITLGKEYEVRGRNAKVHRNPLKQRESRT